MYLKSIHVQGFKSFAEKINIELDNNITGVVGPNGSGKSNVVDAIRWVLGEQSIKSLRGEGHMTDVIFSGSSSRHGSNIATVTLTFDNTDKYINLDFDEIAIKRRLYKDGSNEYYINNEKVRLKDVSDLLLDSGMAKESFNIISQGKIEEILSSKPEERRIIFEEAAGVLKYKKRKLESVRKLEKTHDNMQRINDIINELETRVGPLKEQSDKAKDYIKVKDELKNIEISLIALDITNMNYDYQKNKEMIKTLTKELESITTSNRLGEAQIEKYKNDINNLELKISLKQKELMEYSSKLEQINSRKAIINERIKYTESDKNLENLMFLKENQLKISSEIEQIKNNFNKVNNEVIEETNKYNQEISKINELKTKKSKLNEDLRITLKSENDLKNKIDTLRYSIDNNSSVPHAVKQVLDNPKLRGVHNIVSNLFEVEEKYSKAISIALGIASVNIVIDDETCAKEAINYLKNNQYGRVTFFPLNIIKPRFIDNETKNNHKLTVASELIRFDSKYSNIIMNLLGNVIVVNNIDEANSLARLINYRYRIVTLDGDIVNVGGSLTGGKVNTTNIILEKYKLEQHIKELSDINSKIDNLEEQGNLIDHNLKSLEDKSYLLNKIKFEKEIILNNLNVSLKEKEEQYKINELDLNSNKNILNNKVSEEQESILKEYYDTLNIKNNISLELEKMVTVLKNLKDDLSNYEFSIKKENSIFNEKNEFLKQAEILVNRLDVKLDNLLNNLSETYEITYEEAIKNYKLEIDVNVARSSVSSLKRKINEMGTINIAAIEEYEEVFERLEFLSSQKNDLISAENVLLDIISQMDKIMIQEFEKTFKLIRENFRITFKELFKGGSADLKLTDSSNLLETGVEIIASPPGKSLKHISLLSGGEKTFTAISLLFAILKSKPVPFCVLDEVEAALDDVNVDSFGKYVQGLKDKTQFIIITHKKKTMEYVDTLYGITMQESGVSKLVSVKLEEIM